MILNLRLKSVQYKTSFVSFRMNRERWHDYLDGKLASKLDYKVVTNSITLAIYKYPVAKHEEWKALDEKALNEVLSSTKITEERKKLGCNLLVSY